MTKTPDYTKTMQDMMASFPMDMSAFQNAFKTQAAFSEKLSKVALEAADKSTEISSKWAKDMISRMSSAAKAKAEVSDYSKAATDFASAASEMATENFAAFAEVAKKVQTETVELMMAAGKDASTEASAAMTKVTTEATKVATDATNAAKKAATAATAAN